MFDKYQELGQHFVFPYTFELDKNGKKLVFIGARHSNDPQNQQFKTIKNRWYKFLKDTKDEQKVVVTEGGEIPELSYQAENESNAIQKFGEPGFTQLLAEAADTTVVSSEPDAKVEIDTLLKTYSREEIIVLYFSNIVFQWQRSQSKMDLDTYIHIFLWGYFGRPEWKDFDFSPSNLRVIFKKATGKDFDENDKDTLYKLMEPTDNNISGVSSNVRDEHILKKIKELWTENNMFIVYGSGHAIRLEQALRNYASK
jgi:hypothetical protein